MRSETNTWKIAANYLKQHCRKRRYCSWNQGETVHTMLRVFASKQKLSDWKYWKRSFAQSTVEVMWTFPTLLHNIAYFHYSKNTFFFLISPNVCFLINFFRVCFPISYRCKDARFRRARNFLKSFCNIFGLHIENSIDTSICLIKIRLTSIISALSPEYLCFLKLRVQIIYLNTTMNKKI